MKRSLPAWACLGLALAGCDWVDGHRELAPRQRIETEFVESLASGSAGAVRETLDRDPTLANAFRMLPARRRPYRAESALTFALKHAPPDVIAVLLEKGADPNLPQSDGVPALSVAIGLEAGWADKVALLLEKGADPEKVFDHGSALHHAASVHSAKADEIFPLLLAKATGVGHYDAAGRMPLHAAASSANPAVIRLLVGKGAEVNVRTKAPRPEYGMSGEVAGATPLAIVARDRQIAAAATLCALGADPDLADATGASARQVAARIAGARAPRRTARRRSSSSARVAGRHGRRMRGAAGWPASSTSKGWPCRRIPPRAPAGWRKAARHPTRSAPTHRPAIASASFTPRAAACPRTRNVPARSSSAPASKGTSGPAQVLRSEPGRVDRSSRRSREPIAPRPAPGRRVVRCRYGALFPVRSPHSRQ